MYYWILAEKDQSCAMSAGLIVPGDSYEIFFSDRDEIQHNPRNAQYGHKKVESVPSRLPIANETQRNRFHHCFHQKEKGE